MARCRSNECLWREKVRLLEDGDSPRLPERPFGFFKRMGTVPVFPSEMLCSYDCYEQTYASAKPILFAPPTAEQKTEARRQALYRLPILVRRARCRSASAGTPRWATIT